MLQTSRAPSSTTRMICSGVPMVAPPRRLERSRFAPVGMLVQRLRHVRRAVEHGAALALDQLERRAGVEVLLQHDAAAVGEEVEERVLAAEAPEERHRQPQAVVLGHFLALADVPHVLDQRVMLDLDALGERGRARGVEEVGHVLGTHRALRGVDGAFRHRIGEREEFRVGKPVGARAARRRRRSARAAAGRARAGSRRSRA